MKDTLENDMRGIEIILGVIIMITGFLVLLDKINVDLNMVGGMVIIIFGYLVLSSN